MQNKVVEPQDIRNKRISIFNLILSKMGIFSIVLLLVILGILISNKFLTVSNFTNIINAGSILAIVAVGGAFVTYSGHFADMSVPSIMAISGLISVSTLNYGFVISLFLGICAGLVVGLINAFVIGKLKVNPILWTLAMSFLVNGFIRWAYSGTQIYPDVQANGMEAGSIFVDLARMNIIGGVPLIVVVMLIMVMIFQFVLTKTKFGKQLKIVGSSIQVAKLTGINVPLSVGTAFMISALTASIGGIFFASLTKVGAYYNGAGYEFMSVTAIVIGGVSLAGGRGNIIGVLGGVFTLGLLNNLMTLINIGTFSIDTFSQKMIQGIIFIIVVGIQAKSLRKLGRDDA